MQLSVTSLDCAIRHFAGPSSIHSLPTEQYDQDVLSLGMHSAVVAMDALECLLNEVAMARKAWVRETAKPMLRCAASRRFWAATALSNRKSRPQRTR